MRNALILALLGPQALMGCSALTNLQATVVTDGRAAVALTPSLRFAWTEGGAYFVVRTTRGERVWSWETDQGRVLVQSDPLGWDWSGEPGDPLPAEMEERVLELVGPDVAVQLGLEFSGKMLDTD